MLNLNNILRSVFLIITLGIVGLYVSAKNNADAPVLRAGTAKVNITPEKPRYAVHDSLYARSLILECGDTKVGFITLDLGGYENPKLSERLKKKFGLDELYFCVSHTHSGEKGEARWLENRLENVMAKANKDMFDARVAAGHRSFPPIAFNRLIVRENGHAREAWFADEHYKYINRERLAHGPIDPSVGVLKLEDAQGNLRAVVMNFACHADAVFGNYEISADYVGYATRYAERAFGNGVNCLFVQGAAGNQAPMFKDPGRNGVNDPRKSDYSLINRMGKLLAIETVKLTESLRPDYKDKANLQVRTDSLNFTGRFDKSLNYNVHFSVLRINDKIAIATFPGEPFIKFQIDWKREMGGIATPLFFGYTWNAGRWPIYVPDVRSSALGGFGADWGPQLIEVGAGERIFAKLLENYYEMIGLMRHKEGPDDHIRDDQVVITEEDLPY